MVPLTVTGPEVFFSTMTTFISDYYDTLEETIAHMNSLKLKCYPGENNKDFFAAVSVDAESFESAEYFNLEHLGHITCIF